MNLPAIAPAPVDCKPGAPPPPPPTQRTMGYSCQTCARRKVKCDKTLPSCAACRKSGTECVYEAPPARGGKKLVTRDVLDRLARYERVLRRHGLLDAAGGDAAGGETARSSSSSQRAAAKEEPISLHWNATTMGEDPGAVIADAGKVIYVDGSFLRNMGVGDHQLLSDGEDSGDEAGENQVVDQGSATAVSDPLTDALMGGRQSLGDYHPTMESAMVMWNAYVENVEPITKILHVPSTTNAVEKVAREPQLATSRDECLCFAIYHFAVFSMTENECLEKLSQPRSKLLSAYHFATRQALVNASFLKTTELTVLQAFILFLLPSRYTYDAHTYWILTGAAVRLGQRNGLHRDGSNLGLAPFDTEMRRRLFYPLLSLDGIASQMAGCATSQLPESWDTRQPLNINDNGIRPGMTEWPEEQTGATDMMFRLSRTCIGKAFAKAGRLQQSGGGGGGGGGGGRFDAVEDAERAIREAECEVEERYIRYCDVVNPLHYLSMALARSGILAMRLRVHLSRIRNKTATDADKREALRIALRILDTDNAVCTHPATSKFRWHTQSFFLWGMWDSLTYVLNSLWKEAGKPNAAAAVFAAADIDAAWDKVGEAYQNHGEMLESKQTIHVAFRKLTLVAWEAQRMGGEPVDDADEPPFVTALRERQQRRRERRAQNADTGSTADGLMDTEMMNWPSGASSSESPFDFSMDDVDWTFWDGLLHGGTL